MAAYFLGGSPKWRSGNPMKSSSWQIATPAMVLGNSADRGGVRMGGDYHGLWVMLSGSLAGHFLAPGALPALSIASLRRSRKCSRKSKRKATVVLDGAAVAAI
jgi:hypothetical protein